MKTTASLALTATLAVSLLYLLDGPGPEQGAFGRAFAAAAGQFGGGFGGVQEPTKLVERFDANGDARLDSAERQAAKAYVATQSTGRRGRGGRGFRGQAAGPVEAGPQLARSSVRTFPDTVPFYDPGTLRTLFIDFEDADWEQQLMAFKDTDVEVPAALTIDGETYRDVDVHFRGASSFMMVPEGRKHSLNLTLDAVHEDQEVGGYNSLNLLNSHGDPTYLRSVLFLQAARDFLPAAKANFARVVINGESWGIYTNVQQLDKAFLQEEFDTREGTRWKVPGSPRGRGGLEYFGPDVDEYRRVYEIKGKDDPAAWEALVALTRVLNETPADDLEAALSPMLDIDGALRFLALDNALVNNDGYWVRASDYYLYLDPTGRFHVLPHDTNETFPPSRGGAGVRPPAGGPGRPGQAGRGGRFGRGGGRGGRGEMRGGNAALDPLVGLDDASKPLRSKLLSVPTLRARYLDYARDVATKWLDWNVLEPLASSYQALIAADMATDTRKLDSLEEFHSGVEALKAFTEQRRALILGYVER